MDPDWNLSSKSVKNIFLTQQLWFPCRTKQYWDEHTHDRSVDKLLDGLNIRLDPVQQLGHVGSSGTWRKPQKNQSSFFGGPATKRRGLWAWPLRKRTFFEALKNSKKNPPQKMWPLRSRGVGGKALVAGH